MATISIPFTNDANQSLTTVLDGQQVRLQLRWQPSDRFWYGSLEYPVGTPVIVNRRIVLNQPLIAPAISTLDGDIYCRSLNADAENPTRNSWGTTHRMLFEN